MHRRWCTVLVLLWMLVLTVTSLQSAEDKWSLFFEVDNGSGMHYGPRAQCGVAPGSSDQFDDSDRGALYGTDITGTTRWAASRIGNSNETLTANLGAPGSPVDYGGFRAWHMYVGGMPQCDDDPMRIRIYRSIVEDFRPPDEIGGIPVCYRLVMRDNKGVAGAPANGSVWELPVTTDRTMGYVPLPLIRLSAASHEAMIAEGYRLDFEQYVVPEPASLPALGSGMLVLAGLAMRRRRR